MVRSQATYPPDPVRVRRVQEQVEDLAQLTKYGLSRHLTNYYYIAHYYPLRAMEDVSESNFVGMLQDVESNRFEIYLHYPFCEVKCSFCHFYKELAHGGQDSQAYLELLEQELAYVCRRLGFRPRVKSLYIGGGTPSLMSRSSFERLYGQIEKWMDLEGCEEFKFEVFPKSYDENELRQYLVTLKAFGVTDLVVDLESGNPESLRLVGRRNSSSSDFFRVVNMAAEVGIASIVTALVVGLPKETLSSLHDTITSLIAHDSVKVINVFPLIIRYPDPIFRQYSRNTGVFHTAESRELLWLYARDLLASEGFVEGPLSYWRRRGKRSVQQEAKFECVNLLGFGPSAFGYLNGPDWAAQYFNFCNMAEWGGKIKEGKIPIWRAGMMDQGERARRKLIFGLANCQWEDLGKINKEFGVDIDNLCGRELAAFEKLDLVERDQSCNFVQYTDRGLRRVEELSYHLSSQIVKDVCSVPNHALAGEVSRLELLTQHYFITVPDVERRAFELYCRSV